MTQNTSLKADEWPLRKISDMSEKITVGFVGSMSHLFQETGVPLLRGQNIEPYKLSLNSLKYISTETHKKWRKSSLEPGDVAIVRVGYPGTSCVIPQNVGPLNAASLVIIRTNPQKLNPYYLSYVLNSDWGKQKISSRLVGAAQQVFNTKVAADMSIPAPPIDVQNEIAGILGTVDVKIQSNRLMNETLEKIGQALFNHYFILNPKAKEWVSRPISKQVEILSGGTPKTSESSYWGGCIPWFSVVDAPNGSDLFTVTTSKYITEVGLNNSAAKLIPKYTTIISARGTVGKLAVAGKEMTINQSCYALHSDTPFYTYLMIDQCLTGIKARVHGSVFDTITRSTFDQLKFVMPPTALLTQFEDNVEPLFLQILANVEQTQTLTILRDTLLPRLINGKIKL